MVKLSKRIDEVSYAIRDVLVHAKKLEAKGRKIVYMNVGDPLKYDFDTPEELKEGIYNAVKNGKNGYSDSKGLPELREAISKKEKEVNGALIDPEDIIITSGVSEAINVLMASLLDSGDEVVLPNPAYPSYTSYSKFYYGKPVFYRTDGENMWVPNTEDLKKKISEETKAIFVINPNNPTGAVYERKTLKEIIDIAGEYGIPLVCDEIYDQIVYDGKFVSMASLSKDVPIIGLNGFSKTLLITGWRLGYIYFKDDKGELSELKNGIEKILRVRLCPNTPAQHAVANFLNKKSDHLKKMVEKLRVRRDYVIKRVGEIDLISCVKPKGAFYIFPRVSDDLPYSRDSDLVLDLLRGEGILLVPGSGFSDGGLKGLHFRMVFLPKLEVLEDAMDRIEKFLNRRKCKGSKNE
ncbi:MAG: aminotransferase class I/II-fold pyridoxal phosphate-dependent enzyme [Candidatus Asgardarchaeia archaeon]